jgi:hypothetical protein
MHSFPLVILVLAASLNVCAQSPVPSPPSSSSSSAPDDPDRTRSGCVAGTVTDANGSKVIGADVGVKDLAAGPMSTAVTDRSGSYVICGLLPGDYAITVSKGSLAAHPEKITVTDRKMTKDLVLK